MRKALEKGVPADKVLDTFGQEGKFNKKFYKRFLAKYNKKKGGKKYRKGAKKAAAAIQRP